MGGTQAALAGAQVAEAAPSHFEEKGNFAAGLTKTVEETGGLLTGSIDELEQGAKLFSVFAQAYTDITLKRIENFSKTFNKRFKCNTECRKLEGGTDEKVQCEKDFCKGFVKPKTKNKRKSLKNSRNNMIMITQMTKSMKTTRKILRNS